MQHYSRHWTRVAGLAARACNLQTNDARGQQVGVDLARDGSGDGRAGAVGDRPRAVEVEELDALRARRGEQGSREQQQHLP